MKIVEIIGAPASGKSYLYAGLKSKYPNIFSSQDGIPDSLVNRVKQVLTGRTYGRDKKEYLRLAEVFFDQRPELVNALWCYVGSKSSDYRGIDTRFSVAHGIFAAMGKQQSILDMKSSHGIFLLDEGLFHKVANIASPGDDLSFLPLLPRPCMLLLVETNIELVLERALARDSVMYNYKASRVQVLEETLRKQKSAKAIADFLEGAGVRVLRLDGQEPLKPNVEKVLSFISI